MPAVDAKIWNRNAQADVRLSAAAKKIAAVLAGHAVDGVVTMSLGKIADAAEVIREPRQQLLTLQRHGFLALGHTRSRRQSLIKLTTPPFVVTATAPEAAA
jgi:hypothetical protein